MIQRCEDNNILVVAAAGNDGCDCLHVPAALPFVLAVGALDTTGEPLETSNWGKSYRTHGVLAPGENIVGAVPGERTAELTGSSFAAPIVSGVAAALMSIQKSRGLAIKASTVRDAILESAVPCRSAGDPACERYLACTLNVPSAYSRITEMGFRPVTTIAEPQVPHPEAGHDVATASEDSRAQETSHDTAVQASGAATQVPGSTPALPMHEVPSHEGTSGQPAPRAGAIPSALPSGDCGCKSGKASYVYAIGEVGTDFRTEANRDGFRTVMPDVQIGGWAPMNRPANPYDIPQLCDYLDENPWEATQLTWTLNFDLTPVYAIEAEIPFGEIVYEAGQAQRSSSKVYAILRDALRGQALPDTSRNYVSRVSIPGILTNRTVRLFSGQVVPVVVAQARGMYSWNEPELVNAAMQAVQAKMPDVQNDYLEQNIRAFLDKVYYQLRNLGQNSADRALNYAATNAFVFTSGILNGILSGQYVPGPDSGLYSLDTITASKSAYCRVDSDCWDIQVTFFDPENERRARVVYQYVIDVSNEMPVSVAKTHQFLMAS